MNEIDIHKAAKKQVNDAFNQFFEGYNVLVKDYRIHVMKKGDVTGGKKIELPGEYD